MLISTFLLIERLPNVYEARATVVTSGAQSERQAVNARVAATTERLQSRTFLEPVIEHYDPYNSGGNIDAAVARMRQDIKVDTTYRNDFPERLTIAYRHTDPAVAKAVADDLVSVFDKMNEVMGKNVADNANNLASEITDVENRLREMGKLRAASAARQSAAGRAIGEMSAARSQRLAAASSIETLTDRQFALQQQMSEQKRQIEEQKNIAKLAPSDAKASSSYGVMLVRKAELEGQLKEYGAQYTAKNPKVIQARTQLGEINHQIAELNAGGDQNAAPANSAEARELRSMQRELARMQTDLTVTERELERKKSLAPGGSITTGIASPIRVAPSTEGIASASAMPVDYETLRKRYDMLLNRQDQLERAQVAMAGLDPGIYQIVDMPTQPRIPVGPNRLKYRLVALGLALGVALLVVFVLEFPKLYAITDDRDVEYYLGVPVIALIPETAAQPEGRSRQFLLGRAIGVFLIAALLSAVLVLILLNYPRIFTQVAALIR
jgi:uncharacterized protein involved in exopolysaccharide biosynthesis